MQSVLICENTNDLQNLLDIIVIEFITGADQVDNPHCKHAQIIP